jgi:hypothetical protein
MSKPEFQTEVNQLKCFEGPGSAVRHSTTELRNESSHTRYRSAAVPLADLKVKLRDGLTSASVSGQDRRIGIQNPHWKREMRSLRASTAESRGPRDLPNRRVASCQSMTARQILPSSTWWAQRSTSTGALEAFGLSTMRKTQPDIGEI